MGESTARASNMAGVALESDTTGNAGGTNMFDGIRNVGQFLQELQTRMRHGQAACVPLRLLRLELKESDLQCDWIVRPPNDGDGDLRAHVSGRNESWQALNDALTIRQLIFAALPDVRGALLRAYRGPNKPTGLIIEGKVSPGKEPAQVLSLTMRAKLNGFRFCIENGVLLPLLAD